VRGFHLASWSATNVSTLSRVIRSTCVRNPVLFAKVDVQVERFEIRLDGLGRAIQRSQRHLEAAAQHADGTDIGGRTDSVHLRHIGTIRQAKNGSRQLSAVVNLSGVAALCSRRNHHQP